MKVSVGPKTIVHPHPVFIVGSYGPEGKPNLATVSWGGICCSEPPCVAISFRKATLSYHNIMATRAFTVSIPSVDQVKVADYLGIASGKTVDKFSRAHLTPVRSDKVNAPYAEEFPYTLECRVLHVLEIGLHTQFVGEIIDVKADQSMVSEKGFPDIDKVRPILYGSFGNSAYYGIGPFLGKAFSVGKNIAKE